MVFIWGSSLLILSGVEHARTSHEHKDYREMFRWKKIPDLREFNFFKCYEHINLNKANREKTMMSKIFDWQKLKQKLLRSREVGLDYIWRGDHSQNQWNFWKVKVKSEVAQSCLTLCDPMDCSLPGFSIHGIFQARVLEWVAISFSRGYSRPRDGTQVSRIAGRCFTVWDTREAQVIWFIQMNY